MTRIEKSAFASTAAQHGNRPLLGANMHDLSDWAQLGACSPDREGIMKFANNHHGSASSRFVQRIDCTPGQFLLDNLQAVRTIVDRLQTGVVVHCVDSRILYANDTAANLLGWSREELLDVPADDARWCFIRQDMSTMPVPELPVARVLRGEKVEHLVVGLVCTDRPAPVWVMCNAFLIDGESPLETIAVVTFTDITELTTATRLSKDSEERLRLVLLGTNDAAWDRNLETGIDYRSPRITEILGGPAPTTSSDPVWDLMHEDDVARVRTEYHAALHSTASVFSSEYRLRHAHGHYVPIVSKAYISRDSTGKAVRLSGTIADLSERKRHEEQLYRLGFFDSLTELPNRLQLIEQLKHALAESDRSKLHGALLFIDLDNFKDVNDTLGHGAGDELLRQAASRIRASVKDTDIVARFGGDEFVVVLQRLSETLTGAGAAAEQVSSEILKAMSTPYHLANQPGSGTASIGISLFEGSAESIEALLKQADLALHNAKAKGRNTLKFFDEAMQERVDERHALATALRQSIVMQEISIHFQAQVSKVGCVTGAEVLLRWHPTGRAPVPPDQFIPLAEATGIIESLGLWALKQACLQLAAWQASNEFRDLTLSVNVSVRQFNDPRFVEKVLQAVRVLALVQI
jgi:diguanylate cyclase (GGDEF)-like protein/PAS domain S-box-containing protein